MYSIDVKQIESKGGKHTVILTKNGNVYTCGINQDGLLGVKESREQKKGLFKVDTKRYIYKKIIQVSADNYHSMCLTEDGKVFL